MKNFVASWVAKGVVVLFEVIKVEHNQRERRGHSVGVAEEELKVFAESPAVFVPVSSSIVASSDNWAFWRASCSCTFKMRSAISSRTASSSGSGGLVRKSSAPAQGRLAYRPDDHGRSAG